MKTTRRGFLGVAAAGGGVGVASGSASAQSGEQPDWGGWLDGIDGGVEDHRGESEVTVQVGASGNGGSFAFSPAGVWVDPGTTVQWEWTGEGGNHNVVAQDGPADLDSGGAVDTTGVAYEFEFTEDHAGITNYLCAPHESLGMLGAVAVGGDVPTVGGGGGSAPAEPSEMGVPFQAHFVGIATILMMVVSLVYTFFVLKYGESPNASSP